MARGPHGKGPRLVEHLDGSDPAKRKLRIVLETISGETSIEAACRELGIGTTAFHEMRAKVLEGALGLLEPRSPGRPPRPVLESEDRISQLESEVLHLRTELNIAYIREEILLAMPGIFQPAKAAGKKKGKRSRMPERTARPAPAPGDAARGDGAGNRPGETPGPEGGGAPGRRDPGAPA